MSGRGKQLGPRRRLARAELRVGAAVHRAAAAAARRAGGLRTRSTEIYGFDVRYDEGHADAFGPTVVMLHGFSASREVWTRFAAGLRAHHVLIPDLPGHGQTPFQADAGYSAPAQAKRLLTLLDRLGVERAHLIGNSMGGFIAATTALLAPERVLSLGLVDPAGVSSPDPSPLGRMLERGSNPFLVDHVGQFEAFYAMTMARPPYVPRLVRRAIAADYLARRPQLAKMFSEFHDRDQLDHRLGEIGVPAWVVWGRHDQLIDVSAARVWHSGLPDARLTVYEDLGHMPMLEAPGRMRRDYLAFLNSLPNASSAPSVAASPPDVAAAGES